MHAKTCQDIVVFVLDIGLEKNSLLTVNLPLNAADMVSKLTADPSYRVAVCANVQNRCGDSRERRLVLLCDDRSSIKGSRVSREIDEVANQQTMPCRDSVNC